MRRILLTLLLLFSVQVSAQSSESRLSFLLATPLEIKTSVSLDNKGIIYPFTYRQRYGPFGLTPGQHQLSIKLGDLNLKTVRRKVPINARYLVAVTGTAGDLDIVWIKLGQKGKNGVSKIRLVNLMPEVPAMNLKRGSDLLVSNLVYRRTSKIITVSPGQLPIEIGQLEDENKIVQLNTKLDSGLTYTIILYGTLKKPETIIIPE